MFHLPGLGEESTFPVYIAISHLNKICILSAQKKSGEATEQAVENRHDPCQRDHVLSLVRGSFLMAKNKCPALEKSSSFDFRK